MKWYQNTDWLTRVTFGAIYLFFIFLILIIVCEWNAICVTFQCWLFNASRSSSLNRLTSCYSRTVSVEQGNEITHHNMNRLVKLRQYWLVTHGTWTRIVVVFFWCNCSDRARVAVKIWPSSSSSAERETERHTQRERLCVPIGASGLQHWHAAPRTHDAAAASRKLRPASGASARDAGCSVSRLLFIASYFWNDIFSSNPAVNV